MVPVTRWGGSLNGTPSGTVTALAASQGVEAEGMSLTDLAPGSDSAWRAEALPRHLLTQAPAAVAWLAVWESIVAGLTAGAPSPNDTRPTGALPTLGTAVVANSARGVAFTRQCTLVVKGHQRPG